MKDIGSLIAREAFPCGHKTYNISRALPSLVSFSSSFPIRHRNYFASANKFSCPGTLLFFLPFPLSLCTQYQCTPSPCSKGSHTDSARFFTCSSIPFQSPQLHFTDFVCKIFFLLLFHTSSCHINIQLSGFSNAIFPQYHSLLNDDTNTFFPSSSPVIMCYCFPLFLWAPLLLFMGCLL